MSKQQTSQTPRLLIVSAITLLLWFGLFGYVRHMPLFQTLFWVDSMLLLVLWVFAYLGTDLGTELDIQKHLSSSQNILSNIKNLFDTQQKILARRVVPLYGIWFVRAVIDILVHMYIPRAFRLLAALWWYIVYTSLPTLIKDGPMLGNMKIWWYEIALILWAIVALRLIQQNYYSNIDRLVPASVLWWWMLYLMWTYLAGYDITQLKKFISFWFFSGVVICAFVWQWVVLFGDRFETNKIERIIYEEKIIYVPEEIDQYEDDTMIEPVVDSVPISITQIEDRASPLDPTNILDTADTEWESLAQQLLRITEDDRIAQEAAISDQDTSPIQ